MCCAGEIALVRITGRCHAHRRPLLATLTLGWDCDRKAKPFGRGRGTERLVCAVSIMLLVARSVKRRRKGVRSIENAIRGGEPVNVRAETGQCPKADERPRSRSR